MWQMKESEIKFIGTDLQGKVPPMSTVSTVQYSIGKHSSELLNLLCDNWPLMKLEEYITSRKKMESSVALAEQTSNMFNI